MEVSDTGAAVDQVVDAVKNAIKLAGISAADTGRDLQVASIQLILNTVVNFSEQAAESTSASPSSA